MFGIWLNKRLYENLPPMFFITGILAICLGSLPASQFTAAMSALGGMMLVATAFHVVSARNKNRKRSFQFSQLILPTGEPTAPSAPSSRLSKEAQAILAQAVRPPQKETTQYLKRY